MSLPPQPLSLRHDIGDVIKDRYTVGAVLGAGAFGTVYRVEEKLGARTLSLACKEMHVLDDLSTAASERTQALGMFQEEAYLLQTLRHPHIPTAHFEPERGVWLACPVCGRTFKGLRNCPDHGSTLQVVKERFYLVMDFIEGPDLEEKLLANKGRPLEEEQVLDWSLQVCEALAAVHEKGFSHRDIKPANLKLQASSNDVMLIDFGLVKPSTVEGGYGTMVQSPRSQNLGTLGYAPPTREEQAQPDARTDILALGMTLYRLLTGLDPTDAAHLETMRAKQPAAFNARISATLNDIIRKAIAPLPAQRYPDIQDMLADLRAARYPIITVCAHCGWELHSAQPPAPNTPCGRCGRPLQEAAPTPKTTVPAAPTIAPSTPAPAPQARAKANQYTTQIKQLQEQIRQPSPPPLNQHDARLREIEELLQRAVNFRALPDGECPGCRRKTLEHITGQPTANCPICDQARLQRRRFQKSRCPVCSESTLEEKILPKNQIFCPLCAHTPMQEEHKKRLGGLATDVWWNCPHCLSQFDVRNFGQAKLVKPGENIEPTKHKLQGETLPIEEWRAMSGRSSCYAECGECHAQFDTPNEQHWQLVSAPHDPKNLQARLSGRAMPHLFWKKIAHHLTPQNGELFCPHCEAEFDFTKEPRALILRQSGKQAPQWATNHVGTPVTLTEWYCALAGKTSRRPGPLCSACDAEWDVVGIKWKLISAGRSTPLQPSEDETLRPDEWFRRAANVPTDSEVSALNAEKLRLRSLDARRHSQWEDDVLSRREALRRQLREVVKRAAIEGHMPLQRIMAHTQDARWRNADLALVYAAAHLNFSPRAGETVHWSAPAWQGALDKAQQGLAWRSFAHGMIVVTNERLLFGTNTQIGWQHSLKQLAGVNQYPTAQSTSVLELHFHNRDQPFLFETGKVIWHIVVDGEVHDETFRPEELVSLLQNMA